MIIGRIKREKESARDCRAISRLIGKQTNQIDPGSIHKLIHKLIHKVINKLIHKLIHKAIHTIFFFWLVGWLDQVDYLEIQKPC